MAVVMSSHDLALVELTMPGWPCSPRSTIYQYDSFHSLFFIRGVVSYPFSLSERSTRLLRNGPEPVVHRVLAGTAKQPSDEKANYVLACVLECVFLNSPLIFLTCYLASKGILCLLSAVSMGGSIFLLCSIYLLCICIKRRWGDTGSLWR